MSSTTQTEQASSLKDYSISAEEIQALGQQCGEAKARAYCMSRPPIEIL
jgi:hypothetical protein